MTLSIKTAEADTLARAVAAETCETLTDAVTVALRERLERLRLTRSTTSRRWPTSRSSMPRQRTSTIDAMTR